MELRQFKTLSHLLYTRWDGFWAMGNCNTSSMGSQQLGLALLVFADILKSINNKMILAADLENKDELTS